MVTTTLKSSNATLNHSKSTQCTTHDDVNVLIYYSTNTLVIIYAKQDESQANHLAKVWLFSDLVVPINELAKESATVKSAWTWKTF